MAALDITPRLLSTVSRMEIIHKDAWIPEEIRDQFRAWQPKTDFGALAAKILSGGYLPAELARELWDRIRSIVVVESSLEITLYRGRYSDGPRVEHFGVVSRKLVTDNGVGLIVDALDNTTADATVKYHGLGTGTNAEAAGDSALQTELTTEYTGDVRATGTFSQPSANISRSVATNTIDSGTPAVTEHGVFTANAAGILLDRSKFSAINMIATDALQTTYSLTFTSGG